MTLGICLTRRFVWQWHYWFEISALAVACAAVSAILVFFVKYNHQQKQFVFRLRHSGASPHMLNSTSVIQQLCLATTADSPPVVACDNNI